MSRLVEDLLAAGQRIEELEAAAKVLRGEVMECEHRAVTLAQQLTAAEVERDQLRVAIDASGGET